MLFSGENVDFLSIYGDSLYYVVNQEQLWKIDCNSKKAEPIFELNENYMCQIQDYTVADGKVFFLNTHSLFCYDIYSKSINELKNTTVESLQVVGNDIYFTDNSERTNTIYVYSMNDNSCRALLGDGEYTPMKPAYLDFWISNDSIYYCQAMPSGTYTMPLNGECKIIHDGRLYFICQSNTAEGLYYMKYERDESYLYFNNKDSKESFVCEMKELNLSSGVAVVDGYVYYNSGFERVLEDHGHYVYYYDNAKPTAERLRTALCLEEKN